MTLEQDRPVLSLQGELQVSALSVTVRDSLITVVTWPSAIYDGLHVKFKSYFYSIVCGRMNARFM